MAVTVYYPIDMPWGGSYLGSFSSHSITNNDHKLAFMTFIPKSGTLARVGFATAAVTTPADIAVRIETVNSSGLPSGTLYHPSGTGTQASPAAGSWYRPQINGATGITVNAGDQIAVVLSCPTGSPNLTLARLTGHGTVPYLHVPHATYTTSWAGPSAGIPPFAIEYSDGSSPLIGALPLAVQPIALAFNQGTTGTTTGDEMGMSITVPFGGRVIGLRTAYRLAGFPKACLYSGTTLLASSPDIPQGSMMLDYRQSFLPFTSPVTITPGTYILSIRPWNSGVNTNTYQIPVLQPAYLEALGFGPTDGAVTRVDLGAWEPVDQTRVFPISLVFDTITASSGGRGRPPLYGV